MQGKSSAMRQRVEIEGIQNTKEKTDLAVDKKGEQSQLHIQKEKKSLFQEQTALSAPTPL